jgi:ABC-type multidrug transport system ATPase subunit
MADEKTGPTTIGSSDVDSRSSPPNPISHNEAESIRLLLNSQSPNGSHDLKQIGVSFRDLSVVAASGTEVPVKTLGRAILNTFGPDQVQFVKTHLLNYWWPQKTGTSSARTILNGLSGIVKPGEMLLVLGSPGSGCSSFLRTIANQSPLTVHGDLRFAGIPADAFKKSHSRETIYLPEEDKHIASLTVRQTITFALRSSLPSRLGGTSTVSNLVEAIAKLLGLGHALETPVGGAFFPGVSGGERKRCVPLMFKVALPWIRLTKYRSVSIAEVFAAGSSLQSFDNSTRGLDSSTALDFAKALRAFTDIGNKTTIATLYQAGEELYSQFDKVILLDKGHQVFFGSTSQARSYFEDLGFNHVEGQTTAEFLVTVTDPNTRTAKPGSVAEGIKSPEDLAAAFKASRYYKSILSEIETYNQEQAGSASPLPSDEYRLSYPAQVLECLRREFHLVLGQRRVYYVKWLTTIILCLLCGSAYFDIDNTAQGAFTRGGILYFSLIINGWLQFPELFDAHTNRPVVERQGKTLPCHPYKSSEGGGN